MPGLDSSLIKNINYKQAIERIAYDINSDFIFAPHYSTVYKNASVELWDKLKESLQSGTYNPQLPITIEVPKKSGLTRPGTILNPIDRLLYQVIIDEMVFDIEMCIDRTKVFSNVYDFLSDEPGRMFVSVTDKYTELRGRLSELCNNGNFNYVIIADIASYFERIYQHVLINLLRSTNCKSEYISLLEKFLLALSSKDSHGIIQGLIPSDILGNYYLSSFDAYLKSISIEFVRFVDDYWMFFNTKKDAMKSLVNICAYVRKEGLYLNEHKTRILSTSNLHYEETELDRLFESAKDEFSSWNIDSFGYSFDPFEVDEFDENAEMQALEALYNERYQSEHLIEKIDKFCIPRFSISKSEIAVNDALEGIIDRPYLSNIYSRYLNVMIKEDDAIISKVEELFLSNKHTYEWQLMWILGIFYSSGNVKKDVVMQAYSLLEDNNISPAVRAICALISSKHGDGPLRRLVRNRYSSEPSSYVKEAILYSTRYFPSADDRNACLKLWTTHSDINYLIGLAMKKDTSD